MYDSDNMGIQALEPGRCCYHYTGAEGMMGITQGEFWVTERHFLNDKSEFAVGTETALKVIRSHLPGRGACEKLCDALELEMKRIDRLGGLNDQIAFSGEYVISFSLDCDSALMWSEFSGFQGYCLEFDCGELLKAFDASDLVMNGRVIYDEAHQAELVEQAIVEEFFKDEHFGFVDSWDSLANLGEREIGEIVMRLSVICSVYNTFFKKECFSGENEYRISFSHIHDKGRVKVSERKPLFFRIKDGVLMPYVKKSFDSSRCIKSVLIGPKNSSDIAETGLRYFLRNEKIDIPIERSSIPIRY